MHVADFEARAFTAKTARTQCAQPPFVRQFGQRIGLVHELTQLAAAKEIPDNGSQRLRIDKLLWRKLFNFCVKDRHTLFDQPLRAGQTQTALVLEQLAHGADTAATKVIYVVHRAFAALEIDQIANGRDKVFLFQQSRLVVLRQTELLLHLVATHATEVITPRVEEDPLEQLPGIRDGRRITGAQLLVKVLQRVVLCAGRVLLDALEEQALIPTDVDNFDVVIAGCAHLFDQFLGQRIVAPRQNALRLGVNDIVFDHEVGELGFVGCFLKGTLFNRVEKAQQFVVHPITQRAQEGSRQEFPATFFTVQINIQQIAGVKLDLDP